MPQGMQIFDGSGVKTFDVSDYTMKMIAERYVHPVQEPTGSFVVSDLINKSGAFAIFDTDVRSGTGSTLYVDPIVTLDISTGTISWNYPTINDSGVAEGSGYIVYGFV